MRLEAAQQRAVAAEAASAGLAAKAEQSDDFELGLRIKAEVHAAAHSNLGDLLCQIRVTQNLVLPYG